MKDVNEVVSLIKDKDFRKKITQDSNKYATDLGYEDTSVEYKVVRNTKEIAYITFPNSLNLRAQDLANVSAAGAFTLGSAGTIGTVCTSASTVGTASTALVANIGGQTVDLTQY